MKKGKSEEYNIVITEEILSNSKGNLLFEGEFLNDTRWILIKK